MSSRVPMSNVLKSWLAEFLFIRGLFSGPEGKPLYSYQVTAEEFSSLKDLLKIHKGLASHPVFRNWWAAGYCLYVAERFRRYYDAGAGGWSWSEFDEELGLVVSHQDKSKLVELGLVNYWRRSLRMSSTGRDLLGSLFLEGGLPWPLVQSEHHGFGRAVRRGLKHAYSVHNSQHTVADIMALHEAELPQAFQNLNTQRLLAGIVEQLVELVKHPGLESCKDPAAYLDETDSDWRKEFPIPLDEANARTLINDWLLLAGNQRKEQKREIERALWFTCEHILEGSCNEWSLRVDITLPKSHHFSIHRELLSTTRLQLGFYEGDTLLVLSGFVYGKMDKEGITVRFPRTKIAIVRKELDAQIILKLMANGQSVISRPIIDSEVDITAPLTFVDIDDAHTLVANESCVLTQSVARIRLPREATYEGEKVTTLSQDTTGAQWVETQDDVNVAIASEQFLIELGGTQASGRKPFLNGVFSGIEHCLPKTVYLGWPRLQNPDKAPYSVAELKQYFNDKLHSEFDSNAMVGKIQFRARDKRGSVVLKRTFGVLPHDFSMVLIAGYLDKPARLIVRTQTPLNITVTSEELTSEQLPHRDGTEVNLNISGQVIPKSFGLELSGVDNLDPIRFKIPFPTLSARLIDEKDDQIVSRDLLIDEMLGKRIVLCAGRPGRQRFNLRLRLQGSVNPQPIKDFTIVIGEMPVELNLYNYRQEVEQMLAATTDHDAVIHVAISSVSQLLDFNISRYKGVLKKTNNRFTVTTESFAKDTGHVVAEAMLLSDPRKTPVTLPALKSEGVFTGQFEVPSSMEKYSPWIIYPAETSSVKFRPRLFFGSEAAPVTDTTPHSLHLACQTYHPEHSPDAIDQQIRTMADELDHSGWQYLADLKLRYSHLPMSTFEAWIALAKEPSALAVAIYRLELDELFCDRVRDELSTLWECITLDTWRLAHKRFEAWIRQQALPQSYAASVVSNRMMVLSEVVPGFREFRNYIETGDREELPRIPPLGSLLPGWYQSLRRNHESDNQWPTDLGQELLRWVKVQPLPREVQMLSSIGFSNAVTYLPIFMAHVTVGLVKLEELHASEPYLKHAIRQLSEFERLDWYNPVHGVMVTYLLKQKSK